MWYGPAIGPFEREGFLDSTLRAAPTAAPLRPSVTLEAFIPTGARALYGLVGFTVHARDDRTVRLVVPYCGDLGNSWTDSLARKFDDVRIGLPAQYADAVLGGATAAATGRSPSATIEVVEAAHGAVGSSRALFAKLAMSAVELLTDEGPRDDEQLAAFLSSNLRTF